VAGLAPTAWREFQRVIKLRHAFPPFGTAMGHAALVNVPRQIGSIWRGTAAAQGGADARIHA
jgi:hypothetical protein